MHFPRDRDIVSAVHDLLIRLKHRVRLRHAEWSLSTEPSTRSERLTRKRRAPERLKQDTRHISRHLRDDEWTHHDAEWTRSQHITTQRGNSSTRKLLASQQLRKRRCVSCSLTFSSREKWRQHRHSAHPDERVGRWHKLPFIDTSCGATCNDVATPRKQRAGVKHAPAAASKRRASKATKGRTLSRQSSKAAQ